MDVGLTLGIKGGDRLFLHSDVMEALIPEGNGTSMALRGSEGDGAGPELQAQG